MHIAASLWPVSIHTSILFSDTYAPKNPPENASPAAFVSTISSSFNGCTGYVFGESGVSADTSVVEWAPWVMITILGGVALALGSNAIAFATAGILVGSGWSLEAAHASASASLEMMISQYGAISWIWALYDRGIYGADRLSTRI